MDKINNHINSAGPASNMGSQGAVNVMGDLNTPSTQSTPSTSGSTKPINTVDYFDNSAGKPYEQFGNPNYGVPDKPGYAYIPSQATESSMPHVAMSPSGQGVAKSRRIIAIILMIITLFIVASTYLSLRSYSPVRIIDSKYVDAYAMVKDIPLTLHYSSSETRAMIQTDLVNDMNSVMDEVQSDVDEISGLDVFDEDAEAKRLYDAMYDEVEPMRKKYLQDATDVINKLQQTADSLPADQAVNYWLQAPTAEERDYIQEKTVLSDASNDFWTAKSRLSSYLRSKMYE